MKNCKTHQNTKNKLKCMLVLLLPGEDLAGLAGWIRTPPPVAFPRDKRVYFSRKIPTNWDKICCPYSIDQNHHTRIQY